MKNMTIRASEQEWLMYTALAEAEDKPLSTYLKERLAASDEVVALRRQVAVLSSAMHAATPAGNSAAHSAEDHAMLIEVLLLLRSMAGPGKLAMPHGELRRLGMQPYGSNGNGNGQTS